MVDEFATWEMDARILLYRRGVGFHEADPYIQDARRHWAQTGENPYEAFGSPGEFADATAAEVPTSMRRKVDSRGRSATDYATDGVFYVGVILIVYSVGGSIMEGTWTFAATPARLTGSVLALLALCLAIVVPSALRAAGRARLAILGFAGAAVLAVVAGFAFVQMPHIELFTAATPAVTALGVLLLWLSVRSSPARRRKAGALDPDEWYGRLRGVLVGRHDVAPERADEMVAQARDHATLAGTEPQAEFGDVDDYAARVAEPMPADARRQPWWRTPTARLALAAVALLIAISWLIGWLQAGRISIALILGVPAVVGFVRELVLAIRARRAD